MTYLLDTCILSKLRKIKKHPDPKLENWVTKYDDSHFFLSVLTIGEIEQGIHSLNNSPEKRLLEEWYNTLFARFFGRIISVDEQVAALWGALSGNYRKKGISLPVVDGLIAASAIVHNLTVVTENIKDFASIDELKLFSPWE